MERVGQEAPEESSTHKEVIRTIASGVNSLKSKMVTMTNKNKKMWRAVARSTPETLTSVTREQLDNETESASPGRYNLRSTPTRQATACRTTRPRSHTLPSERDEGSKEEAPPDKELLKLAQPLQNTGTHKEAGTGTDSNETLDTKSEKEKEFSLACGSDQHTTTVTVSITELEKAKQMAQHLTTLISNLELSQTSRTLSPKHSPDQ